LLSPETASPYVLIALTTAQRRYVLDEARKGRLIGRPIFNGQIIPDRVAAAQQGFSIEMRSSPMPDTTIQEAPYS
jgi:hypothetical protein